MGSYMVPHQPRGAQRERASISDMRARDARAKRGARGFGELVSEMLARLARARVKCSRACSRVISAGNVSYVLKNDNLSSFRVACVAYRISSRNKVKFL